MGTHQKLNLFSNMKLIAFVALAVFALVAISSLGFLGSEQGFVSRSLLAKNKDDPLYARPLAEDEIRYIKWQQRVKAIDYAKEVHELHDESSRKSHEHSYSSSDRSSWAGDREADKHARRVPIFKEAENRGEDLAEEFNKDLENLESDCESDDEDKEYCKRAIRCVGIHGITCHSIHWQIEIEKILQPDRPRRVERSGRVGNHLFGRFGHSTSRKTSCL